VVQVIASPLISVYLRQSTGGVSCPWSPLIAGHFDTVPPTLLNYIVALYVSSSFIGVLGADALAAEPRDALLEPTPALSSALQHFPWTGNSC
jgi:hypothetical protein